MWGRSDKIYDEEKMLKNIEKDVRKKVGEWTNEEKWLKWWKEEKRDEDTLQPGGSTGQPLDGSPREENV